MREAYEGDGRISLLCQPHPPPPHLNRPPKIFKMDNFQMSLHSSREDVQVTRKGKTKTGRVLELARECDEGVKFTLVR